MLVQLAEHLAIRFALERYEKGEVKVNAVRQMLDRMNQEIEALRKILGAHEDKMSDAGILAESHREILDRQFWAGVPESGKRTVLLSTEAWCIPAAQRAVLCRRADRAGQYCRRDQHPAELRGVRRQRRKRRTQEDRRRPFADG